MSGIASLNHALRSSCPGKPIRDEEKMNLQAARMEEVRSRVLGGHGSNPESNAAAESE